jgi:endoglucanase
VTAPLEIAEALLSLPTAPFVEDLPKAWCLEFAARHPHLTAGTDAAGNVVVKNDAPGPPLVLVAHLDHPAFRVDAVDGDRAELTFVGGVGVAHALPGSPVDFFRRGETERCGRGELLEAAGENGSLRTAAARVTEGVVGPGLFAMWGFPGWSIEDGRITARLCDDLLGVAAALVCLAEAAGDQPVWGLFTRAEEDGLLGAFEAARLGTVPRDASVVSLECSKALPEAPQGAGVIVRVGDRMSVFDNGLTEALRAAAERAGVPHRRKLMDGGVCEATVFSALGWRASGLAVPLGNYHNASDEGQGIRPETVLVDDFLAECDLLLALAREPLPQPGEGLPPRLAERAARAREVLP